MKLLNYILIFIQSMLVCSLCGTFVPIQLRCPWNYFILTFYYMIDYKIIPMSVCLQVTNRCNKIYYAMSITFISMNKLKCISHSLLCLAIGNQIIININFLLSRVYKHFRILFACFMHCINWFNESFHTIRKIVRSWLLV